MKNDPFINWIKKWRTRLEQMGFFLLFMIDLLLIGFVGVLTVNHLMRMVYEIQTPPPAVSFMDTRPEPPDISTRQLLRAKYHLHPGARQGPIPIDNFIGGDRIAPLDKQRL